MELIKLECRILFIVVLSILMLSVLKLNIFMMNVIILSAVEPTEPHSMGELFVFSRTF